MIRGRKSETGDTGSASLLPLVSGAGKNVHGRPNLLKPERQPVECLEIRVRAIAEVGRGIINELPARMQFRSFAASCPELGLSCQADSEEEALNKIQSLIAFQLTCSEMEHLGHGAPARFGATRNASPVSRARAAFVVLYLPYRTQVQ